MASWVDEINQQISGVEGLKLDSSKGNTNTGSSTNSKVSIGLGHGKNGVSLASGDTKTQNELPATATASDNAEEEDTDAEKELTREEASYLKKILRNKLVSVTNEVEVLRKDPNSPLYSVKSFDELHLKPELLRGIYMMGFTQPSSIQENALPVLLANPPRNMIAQAQSGTGKTAAFVLAMLSRVDVSKDYPQCLCLSPTYELAIQTGQVIEEMGKYMTGLRIRFAVRGEPLQRGSTLDHHIIIGTPGTVLDFGLKSRAFDLSKIVVFCLDEADVMISTQGHQDQSTRLYKRLSPTCQICLFSATYDDPVMEFAYSIVPKPVVIRLKREEESLDNIRQYYVMCRDRNEKFQALCNIYGILTIGQCIIFCHTRKAAQWLSENMTKDGHTVALLSGELAVEQRAAVIKRFREGKEKVMITTNVCSRGIDIEQVTVVINYDLPIDAETRRADCETYLHRIGRTGRFGKQGLAINFVESHTIPLLRQIENHFGKQIVKLDTDDVDELEKLS